MQSDISITSPTPDHQTKLPSSFCMAVWTHSCLSISPVFLVTQEWISLKYQQNFDSQTILFASIAQWSSDDPLLLILDTFEWLLI